MMMVMVMIMLMVMMAMMGVMAMMMRMMPGCAPLSWPWSQSSVLELFQPAGVAA